MLLSKDILTYEQSLFLSRFHARYFSTQQAIFALTRVFFSLDYPRAKVGTVCIVSTYHMQAIAAMKFRLKEHPPRGGGYNQYTAK